MEGLKVTVNLPINVCIEEIHLFKDKRDYVIKPLRILSLKNAFVGYSGFCLTENGLIKECHHDYPNQLEDYKNEIYYYYNRAKNNEENLIIFDDDHTYLLIHHPWHNYYHWICEVLLRLWLVRDKIKSLILLLPERCKREEWMMSSLAPFSFKEIFFIPSQKSVLVKSLLMPQIKPNCHSYYCKELNEIKNFYLSYLSKYCKNAFNYGEKVYISRKKATRRKVWNEEKVENILKKEGFAIIHTEEFSFYEQISIFSKVKILLSIHGSGLTNMIWMPEGSTILEMHKKQTNDQDRHSLVYWYLAHSLSHRYFHQVCNPVDPKADFFFADMIIDLNNLKKNLALMEA